jgi:aspartate aminotransferase-like enzyme/phosphatidylglycerophosphate synthase
MQTNTSGRDAVRPPSPPLYTPFYFVSSRIVHLFDRGLITPNRITVVWIGTMIASATALALNMRFIAILLLLVSVLLDCLDGDLARRRFASSTAGSLLERMGHWLGNLAIAAGAGLQVCKQYGTPRGAILLACLCIAQALYLAAVSEVHDIDLPRSGHRSAVYLLRLVKIQYLLMPIELPFLLIVGIVGVRPAVLWMFCSFLFMAALTLLTPTFWALVDADKRARRPARTGFPEEAVNRAAALLAERRQVAPYWPVPVRVPPQVLQLFGEQPLFFHDSQCREHSRTLRSSLQNIFQTQGDILLFPCDRDCVVELLAVHLVRAGEKIVMINGGPTATRWIETFRSSGVDVYEMKVPFGEDVPLSELQKLIASCGEILAVITSMTEASHGTKYDLANIANCAHAHGAAVIVDCTDAIAVDDLNLDDWEVDLAIAGGNGGLMTPSHISVVALSSNKSYLQKRLITSTIIRRWADAAYSEPSSRSFEALNLSTQMLVASGIKTILSHRQEVAKAFRRGCIEVTGLELVSHAPSACYTVAYLPENLTSVQVTQKLENDYHVGILAGIAPDGRHTLSIGHSGWIFRDEIYDLIRSLALSIADLTSAETDHKDALPPSKQQFDSQVA